jgi:hypothetical protein
MCDTHFLVRGQALAVMEPDGCKYFGRSLDAPRFLRTNWDVQWLLFGSVVARA